MSAGRKCCFTTGRQGVARRHNSQADSRRRSDRQILGLGIHGLNIERVLPQLKLSARPKDQLRRRLHATGRGPYGAVTVAAGAGFSPSPGRLNFWVGPQLRRTDTVTRVRPSRTLRHKLTVVHTPVSFSLTPTTAKMVSILPNAGASWTARALFRTAQADQGRFVYAAYRSRDRRAEHSGKQS